MSTLVSLTTTIRISLPLKNRLAKIAKERNSKFTDLLKEAVEFYLQEQEKIDKLQKFDNIKESINKVESWTLKEEITHIDTLRKAKTKRLKTK